ncbi:MAG: hypothetical protein WAM85_11575 [Terracidiphilus sp.]
MMRQPCFVLPALFLASCIGISAGAGNHEYRSATVDERTGQLHIVSASGRRVVAPKDRDQIAFGQAIISPDRGTIGWFELYPDPTAFEYKASLLAERLVLFRNNQILHRFESDQVFWDWTFVDGGTKVAYSTGPTHGGASECVLRDVESGTVLTQWDVGSGSATPEWARSLRF